MLASIQVKAVTMENDIYYKSNEYDHRSSSGIADVGHELTHTVQQQAAGGLAKFMKEYLAEDLLNRVDGMSPTAAYDNNGFELEANKMQQQILSDLVKKYGKNNPCPIP